MSRVHQLGAMPLHQLVAMWITTHPGASWQMRAAAVSAMGRDRLIEQIIEAEKKCPPAPPK